MASLSLYFSTVLGGIAFLLLCKQVNSEEAWKCHTMKLDLTCASTQYIQIDQAVLGDNCQLDHRCVVPTDTGPQFDVSKYNTTFWQVLKSCEREAVCDGLYVPRLQHTNCTGVSRTSWTTYVHVTYHCVPGATTHHMLTTNTDVMTTSHSTASTMTTGKSLYTVITSIVILMVLRV